MLNETKMIKKSKKGRKGARPFCAFGDQYNLRYDISTPDKLKALGITVVDQISG